MPETKPPVPVLETGDFVRLKQPYRPSDMMFDGPLGETFGKLLDSDADGERREPTARARRAYRSDSSSLFEFTHGVVVEELEHASRSPPEMPPDVRDGYAAAETLPTMRVSLHLFNPATGVMYVGGHPDQPGKPEYVDDHIANLALVHKARDTWGNEYDLDLAELYQLWGYQVPDYNDK